MLDPKKLLEQVLGSQAGGNARSWAQQAEQKLNQAGGVKSFAGGAVAGTLLGMMLGGKRKRGGGLLGYGGAAVLGALAHKAYESYQRGQAPQAVAVPTPAELSRVAPELLPHAQPAAGGGAFELVLIRGMIAAAKADGHVDAEEQRRLFGEVERMGLDAEAKAFVFDALAQPANPSRLAAEVATQEQAAELYLASRLAIDPDQPAERAYLDALAARLELPSELRAHLDQQADSATRGE
jgi:uncharacterized membrane protein YebE (DUF533 family)